jgi:Restriction endonuclease
MTVVEKPRKKRIFIASSQADVAEVQKAMQQFDLDAVTLDQIATPGTTWVDSLHRCLNDADMVIGIMGDRRKDTNVFFELGVASALNKPTLLFVTPDYPIDHIPPSGIPYLRMDLRNEDAVMFGLKQALALSPRDKIRQPAEGFKTQPIGPLADQLLARLTQTSPQEFEDLIYEAIKASGAPTIARGGDGEDRGIDFAVWSSDLEPTITNPLLIECKSSLLSQTDVNEAIGRMFRALEAIPNGWGIVLYKELGNVSKAAPRSLPVVFVSAEAFINGLRDTGLAEFVRNLRNSAVHGF